MRIILFTLLVISSSIAKAQPVLGAGDLFPDYVIRNIINAPVKQLDVRNDNKKILILNFWGTWCAPCLPEMDSLAKLQAKNTGIQVIGVSNDNTTRLQNYLKKKPSSIWLASDTNSYLYQTFAFNYVGQSAIINAQNKIIALVRTDSINQKLIDKLLRNEKVVSSAETGNKIDIETADPFGVDSAVGFQVTLSGYKKGIPSSSKSYWKTPMDGRRKTYFNVCLTSIIRDAYDLSYKQLIYEVPEESVCDFKNKDMLYCFDLIVKPAQKDSFSIIMRDLLQRFSPIKFRHEKRKIPVFVLSRETGAADWKESAEKESTYSFSGRGFKGVAILMKPFADYISNELDLPVVDETGLAGKYDIATENVLRTPDEINAALKKLGLKVEKTEREMDVVVIYK
ncbi:MAG: TIGR03435 family protein [Chitinophagaceae bacterium]